MYFITTPVCIVGPQTGLKSIYLFEFYWPFYWFFRQKRQLLPTFCVLGPFSKNFENLILHAYRKSIESTFYTILNWQLCRIFLYKITTDSEKKKLQI